MIPLPQSSPLIAGSVLPIRRAEELLSTLPGVIAARIIASDTGAVDEIHVLTGAEVTPKQTVRNIESALIAHLGMRVDHRKISVATSVDRGGSKDAAAGGGGGGGGGGGPKAMPAAAVSATPAAGVALAIVPRPFYFEDVEVRRSRATGITCRVTLSKGDQSFHGEAEGVESERSRVELAARAALRAIASADPGMRALDLGGVKLIEAFDREFVFVGVTAQQSRASVLLTGSCEVKDSPETAGVLAVLDATNRWLSRK
ncbi:MAG: hypothetical protein IT360_04015 [Gemmatimonadaceae bacterium]|nr:hypothetical protein [Gemmatimonadaceae bacterium]